MRLAVFVLFLFFSCLYLSANAATVSLFSDNKIQINPNSAITVTSNLKNQVWVINTVSDCYVNTWGGAATAANSRKLLANSVYPIQMVASSFSILGTVTENIIITQPYPGVQNTIAIKKKISGSEISTALTSSPLAVTYGGTGASTASNARINLSASKSGDNSDITSLSGITSGIASPTSITLAADGSVRTAIVAGNSAALQAYDSDEFVYKTFIYLKTGTTPLCSIYAPTGGSLTIDGAVIGTTAKSAAQFTTVGVNSIYSTTSQLTDSPTISLDLSVAQNYNLVLAGNRTLGVPTNIAVGQSGVINVRQDAVGNRTLSYSWPFVFSGGAPPTLSTSKYSFDQLYYSVSSYSTGTATISIASPCVVTRTAHGLISGQRVQFTTTGALPTGIAANTTYWVNVIDANTFNLSTSLSNLQAGTYVSTSGTQSGAHTVTNATITITINPGINA